MIALDTNILVYAHRRDSVFHAAAAEAVRTLAEGIVPWAIPWPVVFEFWNIVTHPRIYNPPSTPDQARRQLDAWFQSPVCHVIGDHPEMVAALTDLAEADIRDGQIHDARIALLCRANGITELWSVDRDFSRFPWVQTRNPLVAPG